MNDISKIYLRQQIAKHLEGGEAFNPIDSLLEQIPFEKVGIIPEGLPYSIWQQLYHIRYTQLDIIEFSTNPNYEMPKWPDDYWPSNAFPASLKEWEEIKQNYKNERQSFISLLKDESIDLLKPFSHGEGQTLFREAMLVIEHSAYHTGQLLILMRLLNIYE